MCMCICLCVCVYLYQFSSSYLFIYSFVFAMQQYYSVFSLVAAFLTKQFSMNIFLCE